MSELCRVDATLDESGGPSRVGRDLALPDPSKAHPTPHDDYTRTMSEWQKSQLSRRGRVEAKVSQHGRGRTGGRGGGVVSSRTSSEMTNRPPLATTATPPPHPRYKARKGEGVLTLYSCCGYIFVA